MLKYRLLTAAVLVPLIIWGILTLPVFIFALVMAAVMVLGAWEWTYLVEFESWSMRLAYIIILLLGLYLSFLLPTLAVLLFGLIVWLWASFGVFNYAKERNPLGLQWISLRIVLGIAILIPCWIGFVVIRAHPQLGPAWLIYALALIWIADSGAYACGRLWGKRSFCARVSPNKTWEGFWGGVLFAMILAVIMSYFFMQTWPGRIAFIGVSLCTVWFAIMGDLTESTIKRLSGIKDSGQWLPGHGGLLDRLDSITAGITIFALGALLLNL